MIAQKNKKGVIRTVYHLPKYVVSFEILWRYIPYNLENNSKEMHERWNTKIGLIKSLYKWYSLIPNVYYIS